MCKIGDIILVKKYKSDNKEIGMHSFVVISDEEGEIQGLPYDIVCNVLSSLKGGEHRKRKLSYPGNLPITSKDTEIPDGNQKDGYIKAEQFYYFKKELIDYTVIGNMTIESFNMLIDFIYNLPIDIIHVTDNLKWQTIVLVRGIFLIY